MSVETIKLPGKHNVENYMAAILAVYEDIGCDNDAIISVASSFGGVEHRLEFVRELNGVKYYNSSIDSSPNRTIKALSVFKKRNVIMIAGGKDKKIPYDDIGEPVAKKVKTLILTGPTAEKIQQAVVSYFERHNMSCDVNIIRCDDYESAVKSAFESAEEGDNVLLSPASTSFDMFKNFEERGKIFKKLVNELC
jgi:UDP-N-acetylmuramoylalanine--D-glutamate ligase